ncbi:MAG: universal stress protein [Solirubrobacterales bacterium]
MACYRHILVAVDGSPDADAALLHAAALARDQNALLTLLTVASTGSPTPVGPGTGVPADPVDLHGKILRQATDSLPDDVGVTTRLERGDPAAAIIRVADEGQHDLIVMGSHGHSRFRRALLGSVSERVLADSRIPVLLMRSAIEASPAPE